MMDSRLDDFTFLFNSIFFSQSLLFLIKMYFLTPYYFFSKFHYNLSTLISYLFSHPSSKDQFFGRLPTIEDLKIIELKILTSCSKLFFCQYATFRYGCILTMVFHLLLKIWFYIFHNPLFWFFLQIKFQVGTLINFSIQIFYITVSNTETALLLGSLLLQVRSIIFDPT